MKNEILTISVIIPTFQGEKHLTDTLQSITNQTLLPTEIIISDDSSTDKTLQRASAFAKNCSIPIKILNHQHSGISANYINALNHSTGDIIIVGDHDDIWLKNKVETIINEFRHSDQTSIVAFDSEVVDYKLAPLNTTLRGGSMLSKKIAEKVHKNNFKEYLLGLRLDAHTLAIRSIVRDNLSAPPFNKLKQGVYFEEKIALIALSLGNLVIIPEALTLYRQHSDQHIGHAPKNADEFKLGRYSKRMHQLELLHKSYSIENDTRLIDHSETTRRKKITEQYLFFLKTRNFNHYQSTYFLNIFSLFLKKEYKKFSRNQFLSLGKDVYLLLKMRLTN